MSWTNLAATEVLSLVAGVVTGVVANLMTQAWNNRHAMSGGHTARPAHAIQPPRWEALPPPTTGAVATRQRDRTTASAGSSDDTWALFFLAAVVGAVLGAGYVSIAPRLMTGLAFGIVGLGVGSALSGFLMHRRGVFLAPGTAQTIIRSLIVGAVSVICLVWTLHATYNGVSLSEIRSKIITVKFSDRPALLTDTFHSQGWALVITLLLGTMVLLACSLLNLWELLAAFAMTRIGAGSRCTSRKRIQPSRAPTGRSPSCSSRSGSCCAQDLPCTGRTRHTARSSRTLEQPPARHRHHRPRGSDSKENEPMNSPDDEAGLEAAIEILIPTIPADIVTGPDGTALSDDSIAGVRRQRAWNWASSTSRMGPAIVAQPRSTRASPRPANPRARNRKVREKQRTPKSSSCEARPSPTHHSPASRSCGLRATPVLIVGAPQQVGEHDPVFRALRHAYAADKSGWFDKLEGAVGWQSHIEISGDPASDAQHAYAKVVMDLRAPVRAEATLLFHLARSSHIVEVVAVVPLAPASQLAATLRYLGT